MMNPSILQLETRNGELKLDILRLDRADARTLEDTGLSEADLVRAAGASRAGALFGAVLRAVQLAVAQGKSGLFDTRGRVRSHTSR